MTLLRLSILFCIIFWLGIAGCYYRAHAHAIVMPPKEYAGGFHGRKIVEYLPWQDAWERCVERGIHNSDACDWNFPDQLNPGMTACHIIYPNVEDVGQCEAAQNVIHEEAHCMGWPAWHPDGHYEDCP